MPLTVRCPGCGSNLSAPDRLAGQAVRCTKCRQPMNLPAVVDAEPAPPARPAMKRAAFADDDPDDRPRRPARPQPRQRSKLPIILLAVGGGLALLLIGVGVLLAVLGGGAGGPDGILGGVLADRWTRETIPGTDCSVEIPGRTDKATMGVGDKNFRLTSGMVFGETADGRVVFMASAMGGTAADGKPGFKFDGGWDGTELNAAVAQFAPGQRLVRRYEVQGRKAALIYMRDKDHDIVTLSVENNGQTITLQAAGKGIDENHPDVRRFVESIRFASAAAAPAAYPPGPTGPPEPANPSVAPAGWQRVTVPGTTLSVEMPSPRRVPGGVVGGPGPPLGEAYQGEATAAIGAIKFDAELVSEGAQIDPAKLPPELRPKRIFRLQGREALLHVMRPEHTPGPTYVQLSVRVGGGKAIALVATGKGIDENTPEVKWFLDSARFAP